MGSIDSIEILGYFASIMVAISFLMKSVRKLRFVNIIGAVCFVVYSIAIKAYPVALINLFTICVNTYYLTRKDTGEKE